MVLFSLVPRRVREVDGHLLRFDVERRHELEVPHVVRAELHVHQTRHLLRRIGFSVMAQPSTLSRRLCSVPHLPMDPFRNNLTVGREWRATMDFELVA